MIAAQPRFAEGHSYIQWKQTLMDHESIAHEANWLLAHSGSRNIVN